MTLSDARAILAAVTSCADIVDLVLAAKEQAAVRYAEYCVRTVEPALRPLVLSLAAQEKDQAAALADIKRRGNLDRLFRRPEQPVPPAPPEGALGEQPTARELLQLVLDRTDASIALLEFLQAHAEDPQVRDLLLRLAGEARRTRAIVASRCELESLGG